MKIQRPKVPVKPATPATPAKPALTALALALLLALPNAWPQGLGGQPPPGLVPQDQLKAAQAEADKLRNALKAAQDKATAAEAVAAKAEERARQAAQSKPAGVPPEQLDALRKERDAARAQRDTALADAEGLQAQLKQALADLKRGAAATKDDTALRTERDRLKRDNQAQQERIGVLQSELADKDKALLAARQAQRAALSAASSVAPLPAPSPAPSTASIQAAPATGTPAPSTTAPLLADGSTLTVAGCGAACPSFVLIPNPGPTVIGAGAEAITARFNYRFAMAKTEVTLGQYKAFWAAPDRNYQPVKISDTYCNWDDAQYAKDDRHPVRCVNTQDAQAYARWFARRYAAQLGVRIDSIGLPTELEWEFSARGGRNTQAFLWADDASKAETCRHAHTGNCPGDVLPVGGRLKNGYGLDDMIGNVWEWTASDWRDERKSMETNARDDGNDGTGVSAARAVRGASFSSGGDRLRLADRSGYSPGLRSDDIGFRLVARIAP